MDHALAWLFRGVLVGFFLAMFGMGVFVAGLLLWLEANGRIPGLNKFVAKWRRR